MRLYPHRWCTKARRITVISLEVVSIATTINHPIHHPCVPAAATMVDHRRCQRHLVSRKTTMFCTWKSQQRLQPSSLGPRSTRRLIWWTPSAPPRRRSNKSGNRTHTCREDLTTGRIFQKLTCTPHSGTSHELKQCWMKRYDRSNLVSRMTAMFYARSSWRRFVVIFFKAVIG